MTACVIPEVLLYRPRRSIAAQAEHSIASSPAFALLPFSLPRRFPFLFPAAIKGNARAPLECPSPLLPFRLFSCSLLKLPAPHTKFLRNSPLRSTPFSPSQPAACSSVLRKSL